MLNKLFKISILIVSLAVLVMFTGCGQGTNTVKDQAKKSGLTIWGTYTLDDYNEQGDLVSSVTRPSESYVQAFLDLLYDQMAQVAGLTITDVTNSGRAISPAATNLGITAAAGSYASGIVFGTGSNAVTMGDYYFQSFIGNGSSSGQLNYSIVTFTAPATVSTTRSFTVIRTVTNNSGATITVNEMGIVGGISTYKFLLIRDVVPGGQAIANGHSLQATYTIYITV